MFDKLIESEPEGAEFKNRRTYFMVSSLVVGVLFMTAVVISIFAADFGLGNGSFELTEMIAPVEMAATAPELPQPTRPASAAPSQSQLPTRQINMASVNEPTIVPNAISTSQNTGLSRENLDRFIISNGQETTPGEPGGTGRQPTGTGGGLTKPDPEPSPDVEVEPPPIKKPVEAKPPIKSEGVINGKATYLPKPQYPAAAIAVRAEGKVDVQVMIDESGKVISATAVSGHYLLRSAAVQAARNAKFSTTYLSKVPVKVTGVIVYNFTR